MSSVDSPESPASQEKNVRSQFFVADPSQLHGYLRALRLGRGMNQAQLAKRLGVSVARVSRMERDPSKVSLGQVLDVLAVLGARMAIDLRTPEATP
jgi:transcriptional regulator with XRE-family HTH domain